jgi:two-component system, cell cycle sensor histidine kinase and response regulator CckA
VHDLTHARRTAREVKTLQDRIRTVLACSPAIAFSLRVVDGQMVPEWVSENLTRLLGYRPVDALRPGWWVDNLHPDDRERAVGKAETLFQTGALFHQYRFRHDDGRYVWIQDALRVVVDDQGAADEVVGAWLDISEQRRTVEEKVALERQLIQAQKMEAVGTLAGGVAHDFNNILSVIFAYADFVQDALRPDDPIGEDVREIRVAAERATTLVDRLLAFSRQQLVAPRTFDLNAQIKGLKGMVIRLIGEDVLLETDLSEPPMFVHADPGQIDQVLINLAVNARDAMPTGGRLSFSTRTAPPDPEAVAAGLEDTTGTLVVLRVVDSGCGMESETVARVFDPFFTTKEHGKGTGLGLSIVHGIVSQLGGHIDVESTVGKGTAFTIRLPAVEGELDSAARQPDSEPSAMRGTETILVAEDDDLVREGVRRMLASRGYKVLTAANAGEALLQLENETGPVHLLLTDVVMPHLSGPELARRLLGLRPKLRVLFMTGYTDDTYVRHGLSDGSIRVLRKPLEAEQVWRTVRQVLDA